MHYPHWLMIVGGVLVAIGFMGFAIQKTNQPGAGLPTRDAESKEKEK